MTPTGRASVGRSYLLPARARERVRYGWDTHFNDDRALGYGIVLGHISLCDGPRDLVVPLVSLGALTGVAEWVMRDQQK
jgi:hypothetical protein